MYGAEHRLRCALEREADVIDVAHVHGAKSLAIQEIVSGIRKGCPGSTRKCC